MFLAGDVLRASMYVISCDCLYKTEFCCQRLNNRESL